MAFQQQNGKPAPARINRTAAPTLDAKHGGDQYGQAQDTSPASIPAGTMKESVLGANMRQSSDPEDLLGQIQRAGVSGRDDRVPADGNQQTRTVSAEPYKTSWGNTGARPSGKIPGAK
jgi:hypothetical protein